MLEMITIEPKKKAIGTVIFLHGLGADGNDLAPIAPHMQLDDVRFIFPHAPVRPITIYGGDAVRAWYDITTLEESPKRESWTHFLESEILIQQIIEAEIKKGIASENIVLIGFSQGGAMALQIAHHLEHRLLAVFVLSGYLLNPDHFAERMNIANQNTPFHFFHGERDLVVNIERGDLAFEKTKELHPVSRWTEYPMGHEICLEELRQIRFALHKHYSHRRKQMS